MIVGGGGLEGRGDGDRGGLEDRGRASRSGSSTTDVGWDGVWLREEERGGEGEGAASKCQCRVGCQLIVQSALARAEVIGQQNNTVSRAESKKRGRTRRSRGGVRRRRGQWRSSHHVAMRHREARWKPCGGVGRGGGRSIQTQTQARCRCRLGADWQQVTLYRIARWSAGIGRATGENCSAVGPASPPSRPCLDAYALARFDALGSRRVIGDVGRVFESGPPAPNGRKSHDRARADRLCSIQSSAALSARTVGLLSAGDSACSHLLPSTAMAQDESQTGPLAVSAAAPLPP